LLIAAFTGALTYGVGLLFSFHPVLIMLIQIAIYLSLYILIAKILKMEELDTYFSTLTNIIHRKK
jgi:hypothetical protein